MNGEFSMTGGRRSSPYCLMYKTPLPTMGMLGLAVAAAACQWLRPANSTGIRRVTFGSRAAQDCYRTAPLFVFLTVYWAVAIATHLNIGHRHILPTYPVMFILCGSAGYWLSNRTKIMAGSGCRAAFSGLSSKRRPSIPITSPTSINSPAGQVTVIGIWWIVRSIGDKTCRD